MNSLVYDQSKEEKLYEIKYKKEVNTLQNTQNRQNSFINNLSREASFEIVIIFFVVIAVIAIYKET